MQPIHACTQFKEILRIIFGPIRMNLTEWTSSSGLTQKEEDYPEDITRLSVPKICFSISPKYLIFLFELSVLGFICLGHPFRPVKKLASYFLASYFMQMRFEVSDLKF